MKTLTGNKRYNFSKDGKIFSSHGYVLLRSNHPKAHKGWYYEHRLVMEKRLGRLLKTYELIHHKNGIITDNRIENLELITMAEHCKHHKPDKIKRKYKKTLIRFERECPICHKKFVQKGNKEKTYCSLSCYWKDKKGKPSTSNTKFKKGQEPWNKLNTPFPV
jgi:hypothetical protein